VLSRNTQPVKKWGPVQASRMSSRIAGDNRTIIEKAQPLKEVQNLEAPKKHGIKTSTFSHFNNPTFISVASSIGVEIDAIDRNVEPKSSLSTVKALDRTVGSIQSCGSPCSISSDFREDTPANHDEGFWALICKHKRDKHPVEVDSL
jgi:hypothetical protein